MRRLVIDNDFRASGSDFLKKNRKIHIETIRLSFDIYKQLLVKTLAFDYMKSEGKLWISKISYTCGIARGELDVEY